MVHRGGFRLGHVGGWKGVWTALLLILGALAGFSSPVPAVQVISVGCDSEGGVRETGAALRARLVRASEDGCAWAEIRVFRQEGGELYSGAPTDPIPLGDLFGLARDRGLGLCLVPGDMEPGELIGPVVRSGMASSVMLRAKDRSRRGLERAVEEAGVIWVAPVDSGEGETPLAGHRRSGVMEISGPMPDLQRTTAWRLAGARLLLTLGGEAGLGEWVDRALAAGIDSFRSPVPEEVLACLALRRLPKGRTQVSFHRGAGRYAPENTLPAFAKAARMGADFVEFDVRSTRDGVLHLLHDSRLDRTTSGLGPITERSASEVARLDAGSWFGPGFSGLPLPTLDAFLAEVDPRVGLYLDAKAMSPESIALLAQRPGLRERLVVYQSADFLERLRAVAPGVRLLPPLRQDEDLEALAKRLQPYGVDVDWGLLSSGLIQRVHALGIRVFSDALDGHENLEDYRQAIRWGIDVIQTDQPLQVYRALELESGH